MNVWDINVHNASERWNFQCEFVYILDMFLIAKEKLKVKCSNKTHTSCQPVQKASLARLASRRATM